MILNYNYSGYAAGISKEQIENDYLESFRAVMSGEIDGAEDNFLDVVDKHGTQSSVKTEESTVFSVMATMMPARILLLISTIPRSKLLLSELSLIWYLLKLTRSRNKFLISGKFFSCRIFC